MLGAFSRASRETTPATIVTLKSNENRFIGSSSSEKSRRLYPPPPIESIADFQFWILIRNPRSAIGTALKPDVRRSHANGLESRNLGLPHQLPEFPERIRGAHGRLKEFFHLSFVEFAVPSEVEATDEAIWPAQVSKQQSSGGLAHAGHLTDEAYRIRGMVQYRVAEDQIERCRLVRDVLRVAALQIFRLRCSARPCWQQGNGEHRIRNIDCVN